MCRKIIRLDMVLKLSTKRSGRLVGRSFDEEISGKNIGDKIDDYYTMNNKRDATQGALRWLVSLQKANVYHLYTIQFKCRL